MKKEYKKPISSIFTIDGKEFVLEDLNFAGQSEEGELRTSAGKDRGDGLGDNSSSGKEDWGYHRSMWD